VTIFESGYAFGFKKTEARWIRFEIVPLTGGGDYDGATFVERGKRMEKTVALSQIVAIDGWNHPELDAYREERTSSGAVIQAARYTMFSKEWDQLLDEYLAGLGTNTMIVADGRRIADHGIRRRESLPPGPLPTAPDPSRT
jgi:hypothetical protein